MKLVHLSGEGKHHEPHPLYLFYSPLGTRVGLFDYFFLTKHSSKHIMKIFTLHASFSKEKFSKTISWMGNNLLVPLLFIKSRYTPALLSGESTEQRRNKSCSCMIVSLLLCWEVDEMDIIILLLILFSPLRLNYLF